MRPALCALLACALPALAGESAKQAASALPDKYRQAIVRLSADNADPDPPEWYFVCRATHSPDGIVSITVRDRRIVAQKPSLDMRVLLGDFSAIDLAQVAVDSRGAWEIAKRYVAKEKNRTLGSVSFLLTQKGEGASPIWSAWCYEADGSYIGLLKLLASTGDVVQWE